MELLTGSGVAKVLGVHRSRVYVLAGLYDDFPLPVLVGGRRVWERRDVERWQVAHADRNVGTRVRSKRVVESDRGDQ